MVEEGRAHLERHGHARAVDLRQDVLGEVGADQRVALAVDGVLALDLPVEESAAYVHAAKANDLATIFLITPTSTDQRLKMIGQASTGFIYAVSRTGVTGARKQMSGDAQDLVRRMRKYTKKPIAVGFGIRTPEQAAEVARAADAAVVGTALVQRLALNVNADGTAKPGLIEAVLADVRALAAGVWKPNTAA